MQHSPEVWSYKKLPFEDVIVISDNNGEYVAEVSIGADIEIDSDQLAQNAARIVACVNFCEGVDEREMLTHESLDDLLDSIARYDNLLETIYMLAENFDVQGIRQLIKNRQPELDLD
jgi:hypothetical protein